jgi:sigma-B regulation protein RsbU (phosphoserine phosphatase)
MLGPMPDVNYETAQMRLMAGDILYLYTDGVTEAKNLQDLLYGETRLQQILNAAPRERLADLLHAVSDDVHLHVNGAAQSDDITMLALRLTQR